MVSDKNIQKHILTTLLESCRKKVDRENIACDILVDLPAKSFDTAEHDISGLFPTGGDGRGGGRVWRGSPPKSWKLAHCSTPSHQEKSPPVDYFQPNFYSTLPTKVDLHEINNNFHVITAKKPFFCFNKSFFNIKNQSLSLACFVCSMFILWAYRVS